MPEIPSPVSSCPLRRWEMREGLSTRTYHSSRPHNVFTLTINGEPGTLVFLIHLGPRHLSSVRLHDVLNHSSGSTNLVNVNEERNEIFINIPGQNYTVVAELEVKRDFNLAVYMLKKSRLPVSDSIPCAFSTSSMTPPTQLDFQTASTFGPRLSSITPLPQTFTPSSPHLFGHQQQASFSEMLTSPLPFLGSDNASTSQCQTPQRLQSLPTYVPASAGPPFSHNAVSQQFNPYHIFSGLGQTHTPRVGSPLKQLFHPGESASPPSMVHATSAAQLHHPHVIHHKPNSPLSQASPKAFVTDPRREDTAQTPQDSDNAQEQDVTQVPGDVMEGLEFFQDDSVGEFRHLMPRPRKLPFDSQPRRSVSAAELASMSTQDLTEMTLPRKGSGNRPKRAPTATIPVKVATRVPNRASSRPDPIRTPIRASVRKNSPKASLRASNGRFSTKALVQVSKAPDTAAFSTEESIRKNPPKASQQESKGKASTKTSARASTATKTKAVSAQASTGKRSPKPPLRGPNGRFSTKALVQVSEGLDTAASSTGESVRKNAPKASQQESKGKASTKTSSRASAAKDTKAVSTVPATKKSSPKTSRRGSTGKASTKTSARASQFTNTKAASAVTTSKKGSPKTPQRVPKGKTSSKTSTQASRVIKTKATSALPTTKKSSPKTPQRVSTGKTSIKASARTSTGINAAATPIGAPTRAKSTPKTSTRAPVKAKSESNKKKTPKARRETPKSSTKAKEASAEFASGGEQHAKSIPNVLDEDPVTPTTGSTASTLSENNVECATPSVKVPVNETTMVFLADGKALEDVNRLTSTLFDQYNADVGGGQDATMLASFYMERVMKARRDFWLGKLTDASGQISMLR